MDLIRKYFTGAVGKMPLVRAVTSALLVEKVQEFLEREWNITKTQATVVSIKNGVITIAAANSTISMMINMKKSYLFDEFHRNAPNAKISRIKFLLGVSN